MSTPYPSPPRRLMRDPSRKLIGGVCSGLAKYLNMDVNLVRILTVLISLFTGIPIVLYVIALFVLPEERADQPPPYVNGPQPNAYGTGFGSQPHQQPAYGQPTPPTDDVWGPGGAPWEQPQHAAPASAASAAPAPSAGAAASEQTWQQPSWQQPGTEPTRYDTAPAEPPAADTDAEAEAEATTPTEVATTDAEAPADETEQTEDPADPSSGSERQS